MRKQDSADICVQSFSRVSGPRDCSSPGSSVQGFLQARILEWVGISSLRGSSQSRDQTCVPCASCTDGRTPSTTEPPGNPRPQLERTLSQLSILSDDYRVWLHRPPGRLSSYNSDVTITSHSPGTKGQQWLRG